MSEADQEQAIDVIAFVGDALAEVAVEVVADWALEAHPGAFGFPLEQGGYLTASIEGERGAAVIFFERAGGSSILAAPRR